MSTFRGIFFSLLCATASTLFAQSDAKLIVGKRGASLQILLSTIEVITPPQNGTLTTTESGVVYQNSTEQPTDFFAFTALTTQFEPVSISVSVSDNQSTLSYSYKKGNQPPNADENGDIVTDEGTTVDGTVVSGPDTAIDLPDGTVVIGSDNSVDNDLGIIENADGSELHTHDNVGSTTELQEILEEYGDNSISVLVLVGHGAEGGVSTQSGDNLDGATITDGNHDELIEILQDKLTDDAQIIILGCDQADQDDAQDLQDLANAVGVMVIANEDPVTFHDGIIPWIDSDDYWGEGDWIEITPQSPLNEGDGPPSDDGTTQDVNDETPSESSNP